ncbi:Galactose oxidase OS=Gibberella zeae (strain PH-1 / ATCC MYA-4620 / FGSC 9075 / NRRL 31084) GN=GAOA PE=3 SV=1 [Rhizoctonia solani AG-1 IB]|uniref:Galactose oxidase n=1 Tax=Thanatephorus cucumeris (strain AG1-IB / isolate 7/3/14) TaxID=1108050 RepID=A0A0B7FDX7_THACB|nr:Galactose oxidase OS=Gibberella zeae (strain PH-1 / ATCC MYA-4620 / FGSC 9075 / NRRL 31084) GN=GAOA PE=3 SV=1 [Rhizoctonia solani AG-1 IB]
MFDSLASAALVALLAVPATAQYVLTQGGTTGVNAMQMTVATDKNVVIIDKYEQNPLRDSTGDHSLGALYSTDSNTVRALNIKTNSFCATGTWLSNGTLVNLGGNPRVDIGGGSSANGLQGIRHFTPCDDGNCDIYESPQRIRMTSSRWYPSSCRLSDGSTIIVGGAYGGGWTNFDALNNPTYEFYPAKNIHGRNGLQIPMQFLIDTLPHNMFPHVILLPNNQLFLAASNKAMLFNWETNTETRLPNLPNGQITVYPMSAPAALLPLTWENNYKAEVVIFGGSQLPDTMKENEVSSQSPTSKQASRIALDAAGIAAGWSFDEMPEGRVMADCTILPDGKILVMNGAKTGTAGYGNVPDQIGQSNADNPAFTPVLYDPAAPAGSRFSSAGMPTSNIARLYHSVSTLLPDGRVMITGSNPNADVETRPYKTEYQVEYISPPYMTKTRPSYTGLPATWNYGQNITLTVTLPASLNPPTLGCSLMDLGFSTHGVHMDMRMVKLKCSLASNRKNLIITGPPNASIYPPGPAWLYVLSNGVPSKAQKVLIGTGASPPVNQGAIDNMLISTGGP